ncbi:MAG: oligosaccharide flippase family protein, partial [Candidatus Latescibacteria bacterium]|nr:oligosaccharide flippase family protein [Candidatus Latescibacterota bacterium]
MTDQYLDEQNFFRHAKNLTGHTATFGFGNMVSQLVSLFMLPIYTAYFTTADYGVLGLIEVTKTLMMYIVAMGIGSAVNRYFFDKEFESKRPEIVVTGFLAQQMTAIPLCVAIWLMADWVSEVALKSPDQATYGKYLAALVWGELTLMFPNNLLRIHLRSKLYAWLSIGRLVVALLGTIVLVVWLEQGILGALRAALGVTAISIVVQLFIVRHDFKGGWSAEVLSSLLKFGLPYVPHNIAAYLLLTADR